VKELFQSTLPQGERQVIIDAPMEVTVISIHAPTRGATRTSCADRDGSIISIHAPTRGATAIFPNFRPCITLNIPKFYQYHSFFLIICS
jgi:hypothetical protein